MRFRIRTLLVVVSVIAIAISWYKNQRDAELGVQIRVPTPVPLRDYYEIPESLLEIRSRKKVREHELAFQNPWDEELVQLKSMFLFNPDLKRDRELLKARRSEVLQIARQHLKNSADFRSTSVAAWIFDESGDSTGLEYIKKRFLAARPQDRYHWGFHEYLGERLIADEAFLESLREVGEDSIIYPGACRLLFESGDEERMVQLQWELARRLDFDSCYSIVWLLEHRPSKEVLQVALEYLLDVSRSDLYTSLTEKVLSFDAGGDPQLSAVQQEIEQAIHRRIREWVRRPGSFDFDFNPEREWRLLAKYGTDISADMFRDHREILPQRRAEGDLNSRRDWERLFAACKALHRVGLSGDARQLLRAKLKAPQEPPPDLLRLAAELFEREEVTAILTELCRESANFDAMEQLSILFEGSGDQGIVDTILNATAKSKAGQSYWSTDVLKLVRRIGSPRTSELWQTIPSEETAEGVPCFYKSWVENRTTREQLIEWINRRFQSETPLTVEAVLACPRDGEDSIWSYVVHSLDEERDREFPGVRTDHQFAAMALVKSGCGEIEFDERFPYGYINGIMRRLAKTASPEFRWTSDSMDSKDRIYKHGFVVNDRLYKFSIAEGRNGSEDRYSTAASAEIMNAVAIRRGLEGRFFCYETEWGVTLIVYLKPKLAKELEAKFGMRPIEGFEFYLEN